MLGSLQAETRIYCIGDSLTQGFGVDSTEAWPFLVEKALRKQNHKVVVINSGISGSTSASGPGRMRFALKTKPDWIIFALGANDGLRGLDLDIMEANLAQAIGLALEAKVKVLLVGMRIPPNYGKAYAERFTQAFVHLAEKYQLPWVPFLLEGVAGNPELNQADGIHPNRAGHQIIARQLTQKLAPLLP